MMTPTKAALALGLLCASVLIARADPIPRLEADGAVYLDARVVSANASSLTIMHRGGLTQVGLESLPPDLQARFGYDPAASAARLETLAAQDAERRKQRARPERPHGAAGQSAVESLIARFGQVPELRPEADLRPRFAELELGLRNQGRRPSCSVFAVVGALEFQIAQATGKAEGLSEEYLIWATQKMLGRYEDQSDWASPESGDIDAGFSLREVAQAAQAYGVALRDDLPYELTGSLKPDEEPSPEIVESARSRSRIGAYPIAGRDNASRIANIAHCLNEGWPVVIGLAWPHYKTLANFPTLSQQKPRDGYNHAVLIVGYKCPSGKKEDLVFVFRNSYGRRWGSGGYGFVQYDYLSQHLSDAILLESDR